jgi:hypothetical protein
MRNLDSLLIGIVFVIWAILATLYATVDMIYMPPAIRVWGTGAGIFLVLAIVVAMAEARGRR